MEDEYFAELTCVGSPPVVNDMSDMRMEFLFLFHRHVSRCASGSDVGDHEEHGLDALLHQKINSDVHQRHHMMTLRPMEWLLVQVEVEAHGTVSPEWLQNVRCIIRQRQRQDRGQFQAHTSGNIGDAHDCGK